MDVIGTLALSAAAAFMLAASGSSKPLPCYEYDRSARNRAGLKHSDVCLSVRFHHDQGTPDIVRQWGATRLEWSYESDPAVIRSVTDLGVAFVGTLNTIAWEGPDQDAELFDGARAVAPWMTGFNKGKGAGWACVNKPVTLPRRQQVLRRYADMGVKTIQHDDWRFNSHAYHWGACFCRYCVEAFEAYLQEYGTAEDLKAAGRNDWAGFDYRKFLKSKGIVTTEQWLKERAATPLSRQFFLFQLLSSRRYFEDLMAGQPVSLTVNANLQPAGLLGNFLLDKLDYMVGETGIGTSQRLWQVVYNMKMAEALNLPQVLSPYPDPEPEVADVRKAIALTYALGQRMLVPWDIYVPPNKPRWFGKTEDYGDLYGFVREHAALLDGYVAWSNVVVTAPLTPDLAANEKRSRDVLRYLMQAGYPCKLAAFGKTGEIVHVPVHKPDLSSASAAVTMPCDKADDADRTSLDEAIAGSPTVDTTSLSYRGICERLANVLQPAYRTDARNLVVLPRWRPDEPKAPRVVHLVNLGSRRKTSLWLSSAVCGGTVGRVTLYRPGRGPEQITMRDSRGGMRSPDIDIDEWAVLAISPR